jgi:hypothetical protein
VTPPAWEKIEAVAGCLYSAYISSLSQSCIWGGGGETRPQESWSVIIKSLQAAPGPEGGAYLHPGRPADCHVNMMDLLLYKFTHTLLSTYAMNCRYSIGHMQTWDGGGLEVQYAYVMQNVYL